MLNRIKRWIGLDVCGDSDTLIQVSPNSAHVERPIERSTTQPLNQELNVAAVYFDWLIGTGAAASSRHFYLQKSILSALARLCESTEDSAGLLPRVPAVLPQILASLRDDDMNGAVLAGYISKDVVLVAELLLEVNSAHYHQTDKITTLDHAILVLGQNGLRMLVARIGFRPLIHGLGSGHFSQREVPLIWEQSDKCAMAGSMLARQANLDPFPIFLAGLIHNVGLIVALRVADSFCDASVMQSGLPRSETFDQQFLAYAHCLTQRIAQEWDFPSVVIQALNEQVPHTAPRLELLTAELSVSGLFRPLEQATLVSKIAMLTHYGQLQADDVRLLPFLSDKTEILTVLGVN